MFSPSTSPAAAISYATQDLGRLQEEDESRRAEEESHQGQAALDALQAGEEEAGSGIGQAVTGAADPGEQAGCRPGGYSSFYADRSESTRPEVRRH